LIANIRNEEDLRLILIIMEIIQNNLISELFITIMSGVIVFIASQYFLEIVIKPYSRYKNIKYKILNGLKFYSRIITNPLELEYFEESSVLETYFTEEKRKLYQNKTNDYIKISDEIRMLSCELDEFYYAIPGWYRKLFIKDDVEKASSNLIGVSNSLFKHPGSGFDVILHNSKRLDDIKEQLKLN